MKNVKMDCQGKCISLNASGLAREIGNPIGANFVMLGKFISTIDFLPLRIIEEMIKQNTPIKFLNKNLEAVRKGIDW